ncbi:elongation factor Ts [Yersinia pseudotuberculosis]|uniref:Elongation factor Ts n=1 Tax=Yersinia pseudotuberculosis TaxID=633 RepID=A0A380QC33_YERPU|nr:elongation factor Ts [Yersinia pseudotuberculosis]PSH12762.1 elongation factor Ts [Yersinia pseudotuberculosis]SUP85055.1 Uncharacterised protein [Yersinia pseudotuberculosis]
MGTKQKQKQIRLIMDALNWSYTQLADIVYEELYCSEHEDFYDTDKDELAKFCATLKKQISRSYKNEERLFQYLRIIEAHPAYQALNYNMVLPKYVKHQCLDNDFINEIANISSWLDDGQSNSNG